MLLIPDESFLFIVAAIVFAIILAITVIVEIWRSKKNAQESPEKKQKRLRKTVIILLIVAAVLFGGAFAYNKLVLVRQADLSNAGAFMIMKEYDRAIQIYTRYGETEKALEAQRLKLITPTPTVAPTPTPSPSPTPTPPSPPPWPSGWSSKSREAVGSG